MKRVAVFGSGKVARPAIRTLLETGHHVVVATDQPEVARALVGDHDSGEVREVDASNSRQVESTVLDTDAAISLLPVSFHLRVAEACVAHGRPFVTTSYVSPEMRALNADAREAGIILLNEVGADPGIDHMQAMRLIHGVSDEGGTVTGLRSMCGGIPAADAIDNPFHYKISWSTRGVVMAGKRPARFLLDGHVVDVPSLGVFDHAATLRLPGLGELESYPNGDSIRFIEEYGLEEPTTMIRGTLRWPGWCETWAALGRLGYLDDAPGRALGPTYADEMCRAASTSTELHPRRAAAEHLGLPEDHAVLDRLHWLGLFSTESVPEPAHSRADLLVHRMDASMQYEVDERDMLVMDHVVEFRDATGAPRRRRASLVEYGVPRGDSAMSRTVGIPAACATRRILDGTIRDVGVRIPVIPSIYDPILDDLESFGIREHVEDAAS